MKIQSMFHKDINRPINGVIKVGQDDEQSLVQELSEYIITKELRRHFNAFFDSYAKAIDRPTDKIGVWISGFFGSGKSHFLKMLSYLLENKTVSEKRAVDYFKDKFDGMEYATVTRCTNIPTESILFNIDIEGPINKDRTAVLRIFAKVFYNHLGFYGDDLKIAKLEKHIDSKGKTDAFRAKFEEINGEPWLEARAAYAFFEDDVVSTLQSVLGWSETAARNWFNGEESGDMSIKTLVEEIKEYVDRQGKDFRLLFCVDEVGQYIGDDGDLMINLQSIVEELGSKCLGKVWVMVTSQEAIDEVTKIKGDDFSKIQGRFNTRLSLSSASVGEVIQKRILEKEPEAEQLLTMVYDKEHAVLKNLFVFSESMADIKGYGSAAEFSATYPFVPYQFKIFQKVLAEIRKHGNSGKHLSGGERSMLSGFQEAAQKVQSKDENALVPFSLFYDTVHTFLESPIRRVIDRCQTAVDKGDGLESVDVSILKLLYLIRYIDINEVKPCIDNIAILMVDDIRTDKISLRRKIAESLERLERQNYIARNGDNYAFLTDEEQDISRDIQNTPIDGAAIVQSIGNTIFNDIYPSKKFKYDDRGRYNFSYDQYVDDTIIGSATGGVHIRIATVLSDKYMGDDFKPKMDSQANGEVIVVLSSAATYYAELELAAKIKKYAAKKTSPQLPEIIRRIIADRMTQARDLERSAKVQIEKAITDGTFYVYGEKVAITHGDAKTKLDEALKQLIESVYSKLNLVNSFCDNGDTDVLTILNSPPEISLFAGTGVNNEFALNEVSQWLELQHNNHISVTMGDVQKRYQAIPYGWREVEIAALVAHLIVAQKTEIRYGGAVVGKDDKNAVRYLRMKSEVDKVKVTRRIAVKEDDIRKAIAFLRNWLGQMSIAEDEDGLVNFIKETLSEKLHGYETLLGEYSRDRYPEKETVQKARDLMADILGQKNDNTALLKKLISRQDDILNATEDMELIEAFFRSQRPIFDSARVLQNSLQDERDYFVTDQATGEKISGLNSILGTAKPYGKIGELSTLMQEIKAAYGVLLEQKKQEVLTIIQQCMGDIHTIAGNTEARAESNKADVRFDEYKKEARESESLTNLDAMIRRIQVFADGVLKRVHQMINSESGTKKVISLRRVDVVSPRKLTSRAEIDAYVEGIRNDLYNALGDNDGIQIN